MFAVDTSYQSSRSRSLAGFLAFNAKQSKHYDVGVFGEKLAIEMFNEAGYKAYKPETYHGVDIHAVCRKTGELFAVEVKTSRFSETAKKWQFCLNKAKHTSLTHSDYLLLILVAERECFSYLIPSNFVAGMKQLSITKRPESYRGKIAPFYNRGALSFQAAYNVMELSRLQ